MCKCGKDELDNTSHICELITTEEIMNIKSKSAKVIKAEFKKFSKHPIDSCFEGDYPTPFSDSIHGVYGTTPRIIFICLLVVLSAMQLMSFPT